MRLERSQSGRRLIRSQSAGSQPRPHLVPKTDEMPQMAENGDSAYLSGDSSPSTPRRQPPELPSSLGLSIRLEDTDSGFKLDVSRALSQKPFSLETQCIPDNSEVQTDAKKSDEDQEQAGRAETPSSDDIGHLITITSSTAVFVTGRFGDIFEGKHETVGKVALKRPRIGGSSEEKDVIRNGTLLDYLKERPDINRVRLLCETASAINYLHENEVVHGDIKASNMLIDDEEHILLCDFGLTKLLHSRTSTAMKRAGTIRWQSPELWDDAPKTFESDVYAFGMTIAESPLLLSAFSTYLPSSALPSALLWTLIDGLGAWCLVKIYRARVSASRAPVNPKWEQLIGLLYLLNPYLFLPNLARSTASLENAVALAALMFGAEKRASGALLLLAILTHISLHGILLLGPVVLLLLHSTGPASSLGQTNEYPASRTAAKLLAQYFGYMALLAGVSTIPIWNELRSAWSLLLPDLTPNPGLWWYFFTEMFDHFRPFFLVAFSMHPLTYLIPVCTKFKHDPLYAAFLLQGVVATFKPYPTLADPGLFVVMFSLFPEVFPYLRHPIVTILLHMHAALLLPLFHSLWLSQGTGNANFYYATTLVFGIAMAATMMDAVWAGLRIGFGGKPSGWEMVQT
ncbi:hypothetical protein FRC00_007880 [Tulasnella sp. 408]|nr:hypothetical protein FRC00_007880 [Tulasnella sp. 408]